MNSIDQRINRLKQRNTELTKETIHLIRANQLQLENIKRDDTSLSPILSTCSDKSENKLAGSIEKQKKELYF